MSMQGDVRVFWILIPLLMAVGIHLLVYGRKRRAMLKEFSEQMGLRYIPVDSGEMESYLNQKLEIPEKGLIRKIMRIKDIVSDETVRIFRCIELLDLNPYRTTSCPHQNHIVLALKVPFDINLFFIREKSGEYVSCYPKGKNLLEDVYFPSIKKVIESHVPLHRLSVTFSQGQALIYLLPLVVGAEKPQDLIYLLNLGRALKALY